MKKFSVAGTNYCSKFITVIIEAKSWDKAAKKFIKEYGGNVFRVEEI